jgi:hypothetical protein
MRKTNFFVRFVLLAVVLMPFAPNAHAFLVTSETAFTIQLVPATPSSSMSLEWTGYSASASVTALQQSDHHSSQNRTWDSFDGPSNTTLETATDQASITLGLSGNDASFAVDFGEDTLDYLRCDGNWNLSRNFTIQGDGWLLISGVHATDYESTPSFDLDYRSSAGLYLRNYSSYAYQREYSYLQEDSSELTDILGVGLFFNDGDNGYLRASLDDYFTNSENSNPVPIPSAAWLLACGLPCLLAAKKIL